MKIEQNNKLRAAQATVETMTTHKSKWEEVTGIVDAVGSVESVVEQILKQSRTQTARSGHGAAKAELFEGMVESAFTVCSGLKAFASATRNIQLFARVDFSRSQIARQREVEVVNLCQTLWELGTEHAGPLSEKYHVDAADLQSLKTAITDFAEVQPKPRQGKAAVSAATAELVSLFEKLDGVLHNQLDPLIEKFKTTEPAFYTEYKKARAIVDNAATHETGTDTNVVNASTSTPESTPKAA